VIVFSPALTAVSGVSTHVNMLLASELARDYEFIHFQVGREGRKENRIRRMVRFLASPMQLAVLVLKQKPAMIHMNTSMDRKAFWRDLVYLAVARLLGVKVVNQIHGGKLPQSFFSSPFPRWLLRRALVASDALVVLTSEEQEAYRAFDPRCRVYLVPNAIDAGDLMQASHTHNDEGGLSIIYVGRLIQAKGLFDAIDALEILARNGVAFHFSIAGDGVDRKALMERVEKSGIAHCIRFVGPVFGAAKSRLWLESDVFLFPTWWDEGLPYALLEALAAGCVPVVCPVGGIPDVMQDGVHGLFVPPRDAGAIADVLQRLAGDDSLRRTMSHNGRARIAEYYTVSRLEKDFGEIYSAL
jgi:glycosyltransferase involved in cell wall biosynthesis